MGRHLKCVIGILFNKFLIARQFQSWRRFLKSNGENISRFFHLKTWKESEDSRPSHVSRNFHSTWLNALIRPRNYPFIQRPHPRHEPFHSEPSKFVIMQMIVLNWNFLSGVESVHQPPLVELATQARPSCEIYYHDNIRNVRHLVCQLQMQFAFRQKGSE